jgi:hypothetical protein
MKTVEDLGREMKAKYPGSYDDMSDAELGRRIKARYPEYSDYEDIVLSVPNQTDLQAPFPDEFSFTQQSIEQIKAHYSPRRGRFTSWWQRGKGEGRNKLLTVLNQEQVLVIQKAAVLEQQAMASGKALAEYQTYLVNNAAIIHQLRTNEQLIEQALTKGLTVETDQRIILETALSNLRVREHERLKDVDLTAARQSAKDALDAADRLHLNPYKLLEQLTNSLNKAYEDRANLEISNDPAKTDKLRRLNKSIAFLEETIDVRQSRLLQKERGNQPGRNQEANTDLGGDYPPESDGDEY